MPAFFENFGEFLGDGSRNEKGETLEEFLMSYDPGKYQNPCCTVDMVVFGYSGEFPKSMDDLKLLLIRRKNHPSIGNWALPGGFIDLEENLEESAKRELYEETHIQNVSVEQIGAFGDVRRDPRARIITTAFMSLVSLDEVKAEAGDDAKDAEWFEIRLKEQNDEQGKGYKMELYNSRRNISMCPEVIVRCEGTLVKEQKTVIRKRDQLASDHAAILLRAYLKLRHRMEYVISE